MERVYLGGYGFFFCMEWGNEYIFIIVDNFIKWVECF